MLFGFQNNICACNLFKFSFIFFSLFSRIFLFFYGHFHFIQVLAKVHLLSLFMNPSYVFSFSKDCSMFSLKLFITAQWIMKKIEQLYDLPKPIFTSIYKMKMYQILQKQTKRRRNIRQIILILIFKDTKFEMKKKP